MTAPAPNVASLTVDSGALVALLRDVRQAAADDSFYPMIAGVQLHTAAIATGTVLAATATDRFVALHGHTTATGSLPGPVWLTNAQIGQVLAALRPYARRRGTSEAEITVSDGKVTIRQLSLPGMTDDLADVQVTFRCAALEFPNIAEMIMKAKGRESAPEAFHVDGGKLVLFARIAASHRARLSLRGTGRGKPVIVQIGDDLIGILMPAKVDDTAQALDVPVYPVLPVLEEGAVAA